MKKKRDGKSEKPSVDPAAYEYMDFMRLEGWIWEFVRRSDTYKASFNECRDLCDLMKKAICNGESIEGLPLQVIADALYGVASCIHCPGNFCDSDTHLMITFTMDDPPFGIPRPEIPYCKFNRKYRPLMKGILTASVRTGDIHELIKSDSTLLFNMFSEMCIKNLPQSEECMVIVLPRTATFEDVKRYLPIQLKDHLKPPPVRRRNDKWKYYLITYDLKTLYPDITYEAIATLLEEAYPEHKRTFDAKNTENYYKNAVSLIAGKYKQYLA